MVLCLKPLCVRACVVPNSLDKVQYVVDVEENYCVNWTIDDFEKTSFSFCFLFFVSDCLERDAKSDVKETVEKV